MKYVEKLWKYLYKQTINEMKNKLKNYKFLQ
jgi:hypothetical protein